MRNHFILSATLYVQFMFKKEHKNNQDCRYESTFRCSQVTHTRALYSQSSDTLKSQNGQQYIKNNFKYVYLYRHILNFSISIYNMIISLYTVHF